MMFGPLALALVAGLSAGAATAAPTPTPTPTAAPRTGAAAPTSAAAPTASPTERDLPADLPAAVKAALVHNRFKGTAAGFRIIALSHAVDACAARLANKTTTADAAKACARLAVQRGIAIAPRGVDLKSPQASHGLYLSHLALILGQAAALGVDVDVALHRRIIEALVAKAAAEPTGVVPSYPGRRERWPADMTATLAAVARADRALGTSWLPPLWAAFQKNLAAHTDAAGLPISELTGALPSSSLPRGSALSFSVRYLVEVDRAHATDLWRRYVSTFFIDVGPFAGMREWPPGVDRDADIDSGPIVGGAGAAATAFGIIAATAVGDEEARRNLQATRDLAYELDMAGETAETTLAKAIEDFGRQVR